MQANRKPLKRFVVDPLTALAAALVYAVFWLMPLDLASAVGGALGRCVGPRLAVSRRARRNLKHAFPEKSDGEIAAIERGMWDNLGRIVGEYPHLPRIQIYAPDGRFEVVGAEYVDLLRDDAKPGIFFSAHIGNWEALSLTATQRGLALDQVYRAANNRLAAWLFIRARAVGDGALIAKGADGARQLLRSLRDGKHIAMLVDQKMNDGIAVKFFGRDAMPAPALAELALRYDCPVVPSRVVRLAGARFRMVVEPPLAFRPTGERHADVAAMMAMVNEKLESWIRETPEQWLWLHNRWPD